MIGFSKIELKIRPFFNDMRAPAALMIELEYNGHQAALIINPFMLLGGLFQRRSLMLSLCVSEHVVLFKVKALT